MSFELNPQQNNARKEGFKWYTSANEQIFEISGPAGSGKTTIVAEIVKQLGLKTEEVLFMAYVGKATMELSMKGNFAKTIHSTIYDLVEVPLLDDEGLPLTQNGRSITKSVFQKKEQLDPKIKLLVVDEGSMPDEKIARDILSFGLPVLVLGDLDQLPPVFGKPFFLTNPDIILTQIMRQSEGDPIIWLSQQAKKGLPIKYGSYGKHCVVIPHEQLTDEILKSADAIICGKNNTRENINNYYRQTIMGIKDTFPVYGDKIVCRQNNWKLSLSNGINLINGLVGYIEDIYLDTYNGKSICIDFRPEFMEDEVFRKIRIDFEQLTQPINTQLGKRSYFNKVQYARAITCHMAQGSQYKNVLVYREKLGSKEYQRKWDYTAITRAQSGLIIAM